MKRFEILEDTSYDRYLIFIYGENDQLCGINYHHGIGDLDTSYLENDPKLLAIYLERMKGRGNDDTMLDIMRASIEESITKTEEYIRNEIIHKKLTEAFEILKEKVFRNLYIQPSELTKVQENAICGVEDEMISVYKQIAKAHETKQGE